jgi:YD repeat-containing protein
MAKSISMKMRRSLKMNYLKYTKMLVAAFAILSFAILVKPARAQVVSQVIFPPQVSAPDANGVDLLSKSPGITLVHGQIGPIDNGLTVSERWSSAGQTHSLSGYLRTTHSVAPAPNPPYEGDIGNGNSGDNPNSDFFGYTIEVNIGHSSNFFIWSGFSYTVTSASYATLDVSTDGKTLIYTDSDGTKATFGYPPGTSGSRCALTNNNLSPPSQCFLPMLKVEKPNGVVVECESSFSANIMYTNECRNNLGYKVKFSQGTATYYNTAKSNVAIKTSNRTEVITAGQPEVVINISGFTANPTLTDVQLTTDDQRLWKIQAISLPWIGVNSGITSITYSGQTAPRRTYEYTKIDQSFSFGYSQPAFPIKGVSKVIDGGRITKYNYGGIEGYRVISSIEDPSGGVTKIRYYTPSIPDGIPKVDPAYVKPMLFIEPDHDLIAEIEDPVGKVTQYEWEAALVPRTLKGVASLLKSITYPEGNSDVFTYDARMNVTSKTSIPKSRDMSASLTVRAVYPTDCLNAKTCNKPTETIDARGQKTEYTYASEHGGVLTETAPPDANSIRPQKRYTYGQRYAAVLNPAGGYLLESTPVWVLTSESSCRASAATGSAAAPCEGNDEVRTDYNYGPDSGPNNLLVRGIVVTAGGQAFRTCYAYDPAGNRISETKPMANLTSCP